LEIDPRNADAWHGKGDVLYDLKNYDEAINYYDRALEIDPDDPSVLNSMGPILVHLGQYDKAMM